MQFLISIKLAYTSMKRVTVFFKIVAGLVFLMGSSTFSFLTPILPLSIAIFLLAQKGFTFLSGLAKTFYFLSCF